MKKINNFRTFESKENEFIDYSIIKDLFIELIDNDYEMKTFDVVDSQELWKQGRYFFEFKKTDFSDKFDPIDLPPACYGWSDLDGIKKEFDILIEILNEAKSRLNDMGYDIAFEIEYSMSVIVAVCHAQHKSVSAKYKNPNFED